MRFARNRPILNEKLYIAENFCNLRAEKKIRFILYKTPTTMFLSSSYKSRVINLSIMRCVSLLYEAFVRYEKGQRDAF